VILLIDNYDSFTYNLADALSRLGGDVLVMRNDRVDPDGAELMGPTHLVVSPGPGRPADAGATMDILARLAGRIPVLGVCLGHQAIVELFGGRVGPARQLVHGKASTIDHDGRGVFRDLPRPFDGGRYHSLAAITVPDTLEVCATAEDGEVMGVRHRELPVHGVQFHPESILTPCGEALIRNFLDG
jgi:anthranilate synthase/aminodeoxychorismate synthase-like glutamine amidotransferase